MMPTLSSRWHSCQVLRADYTDVHREAPAPKPLLDSPVTEMWSLRLLKKPSRLMSHGRTDRKARANTCSEDMPFFVRWFVRFDGVEGQKSLATQKLERVAGCRDVTSVRSPEFCSLSCMCARSSQRQALAVLNAAIRDFPQNPLFPKRSAKSRLDGSTHTNIRQPLGKIPSTRRKSENSARCPKAFCGHGIVRLAQENPGRTSTPMVCLAQAATRSSCN